MPWKLSDIHHLGMTVSDIERSIRFYRDVLGMTLIRRRPKVDADYVARQTGYDGVELNVASFQVSPESHQSLEIVRPIPVGRGGVAREPLRPPGIGAFDGESALAEPLHGERQVGVQPDVVFGDL